MKVFINTADDLSDFSWKVVFIVAANSELEAHNVMSKSNMDYAQCLDIRSWEPIENVIANVDVAQVLSIIE